MPRDLNGNYALPAGNPVVTGTTITSTWANTTLGDIAAEMTDSMSRSGKGGFTDQLKIIDGTALEPGLSFVNEPTTGLFRSGPADMRMALLGVDKMSFNSNGITMKDKVLWADYVANPYGLSTIANSIGTSDSSNMNASFTDQYGQMRILNSNATDRLYGAVLAAVGTNAAAAAATASFSSLNGQDMTQLILENTSGDTKSQFTIRHAGSGQRPVMAVTDLIAGDVITVNGVLNSANLLRMYQNNQEEHRLTSIGETLNRTGTYAAFSDERIKTVTGEADQKLHLDVLNNLAWKKGYLNSDPNKTDMLFVIAQDLEQNTPGLVFSGDDGIKAVRYSVLAMMACNAIKELTARIEALEA